MLSTEQVAPFDTFLSTNPHLLNGKHFMDFYTPQHMFSTAARASLTPPDVKPLPDISTAAWQQLESKLIGNETISVQVPVVVLKEECAV